jgi:putative lipoic acid-binding regulatory protein
MDSLQIEYPCTWSFRIMGEDEEGLKDLVCCVMEGAEYTLVFGNRSGSGKYLSLELTTGVDSREHRDFIFSSLSGSPAVKMIL